MKKILNLATACFTKALKNIFICCLILLLGVATAVTFPSPAFAISEGGFVDMIFVVDESGSMRGEHEWLKDAVVTLDKEFQAAGIGTTTGSNRYGLVGFGMGGQNDPPEFYRVGNGLFGSISDLVLALDNLDTTGSFEDGYAGLDEALYSYPFRPRASVNIVLVTDEDRDNSDSSLNYNTILSDFQANSALLNLVANIKLVDSAGRAALGVDSEGNAYLPNGNGGFFPSPGGSVDAASGNTKKDYADLAWATQSGGAGGAVWDLNQLRNGGLLADSFSEAFSEVKVEEVKKSIAILGTKEGQFEVCASDEVGTRVITTVFDGGGGDYCFEPSGRWSPGNGQGWFDYKGDTSGIGTFNPYYWEYDAFSLVAGDIEGNRHQEYQISLTPELPIYSRDIFFFKMNDTIGDYANNTGCLTVKYRYMGPIGSPSTEPPCMAK